MVDDDVTVTVPAGAPSPVSTGVKGAAAHTGLSVTTIRRLIAAGTLPAVRIGSRVIVRYDALDALVADAPAVTDMTDDDA